MKGVTGSTSVAVPLLTASPAPHQPFEESPDVLSYYAMRRAAGLIGLALPIVVVGFDQWSRGCVPSSISASYYTGARNFFIGSLCSVGIFLITSIGYKEDRPYSLFAGAMAFLVAFCPTNPDCACTLDGAHKPFALSPAIHATAACLLFLTFSWFCLVLFRRSNTDGGSHRPKLASLPRQKRKRNLTYIVCGWIMVAAMLYYAGVALLAHFGRAEPRYSLLIVEWICLWSFGLAWLVKGQQLFKDAAGPHAGGE